MIVRKLLVSDGRTERELLLVGTIVVGRDPSCQLNDLDPLLSRRHAEFVPTGKGVTVRDLKSRNGILVNGDKVPEHALKPGDVIQLGHLHVRYVEEPVVKSPEDHSRVRAKTETGIEVPTMAPVARAAANAPTAAAPEPVPDPPPVAITDDTDLDVTFAPPARSAATAPTTMAEIPQLNPDVDLDATVAPVRRPAAVPAPPAGSLRHDDDVDPDATIAPRATRPVSSAPHHPAPASGHDDADATRVPSSRATAVADPDATVATPALTIDETRAPVRTAKGRPALATEARLVANASLIVTEASPSCQTVIGARPDTIVGGPLASVMSRTLTFVATGDGPSALSVSIVRAPSGGTITVTFKAGQASENHS